MTDRPPTQDTPPPTAASRPTLDELADELRQVVDEFAETVTHELTAELSGLTPEQEIRSDALGRAIEASQRYPGADHGQTLLDLAEAFAGWITTGRRP